VGGKSRQGWRILLAHGQLLTVMMIGLRSMVLVKPGPKGVQIQAASTSLDFPDHVLASVSLQTPLCKA
jgi:hypothetical protein